MKLGVLRVGWPHNGAFDVGVTKSQGVTELVYGGWQQVPVPGPNGRVSPAFRLVKVDSSVRWVERMRKDTILAIKVGPTLPLSRPTVLFTSKTK